MKTKKERLFRHYAIFLFISILILTLTACFGGGDSSSGGGGTASITLEVSAERIPADGVSSVTITATLVDRANQPVVLGTSANFTTTLGTFANGDTTYTISTTDDTGTLIASLMAGIISGTAEITVTSNGVTQSISVFFEHENTGIPVAEEFGMFAEFLNISGWIHAGLEDVISVSVADFYGDAVEDGTLIDFKTYNTGGLLDPGAANTTNGFASSTLYSTSEPPPMQGFVSVTAETEGGPTTRVSAITVTPYPDNHIIYAGTNGGGVYQSINSGLIWENISRSSFNQRQGQNWIDPYIKGNSAICVDPDDHNTVYVGTGYLGEGVVYRSLDGGMNWNSNNVEEWHGIYATNAAVLTVLCDGDDDPATDYPYVWIGTEGRGFLYAADGERFQPSFGTVTTPVPGPANTGDGTMSTPVLSYTSVSETWTATCYVPDDAIAIIPDDTRPHIPFVQTSSTTKTEVWTITCISPSVDEVGYCDGADGDTPGECAANGGTWEIEQPAEPARFNVVGSVSGLQTHQATAYIEYTSDGNEVAFIIYGDDFEIGDILTFSTVISPPFWVVEGTESGVQSGIALNNTVYMSDNFEVSFIIYEGTIPFATGDTFTFDVDVRTIGHGWTVWDIVKVSGTHGATAILYAGTATGVFKSTNGGQSWAETANFTGDYIITLALHPTSTGGGSDVIYAGTQNAGVWVSTDSGTHWTQYFTNEGELTQSSTIPDLLVDPVNNYLYAITYRGPLDQAAGNVYAHVLNANGSMGAGGWKKANTNLPGTALFALAANNKDNPTTLYIGGEGINCYQATEGLSSGNPVWQERKNGLTNVIMTRMPILFSGTCTLTVDALRFGDIVYFTVYVQDGNGNPPISGSKFTAKHTAANTDITFYDITYPDCFTHQGTFRDPGNPYTNIPYTFTAYLVLDPLQRDKIEITFQSANTLPEAPGNSGGTQTITYNY